MQFRAFSEPNGFFNEPGIALFSQLDNSTTTTFYDSVCGIPLYTAPVNRTFEDFKADTINHGWPSFRPAEFINENLIVHSDGSIYSKCGTYLGGNDPDAKGIRHCIDLSCIAGVSMK